MRNLKEELVNNGYRKHRHESYRVLKNTDLLYQKRVSDNKGILYFINCWVYERDGSIFKEDIPQFEVQYTLKDDETCNVCPFYKDIAKAESFFMKLWEKMDFDYDKIFH